MLPQIRHIIVNMFSRILIYIKIGICIGSNCQIKVIPFKRHKQKRYPLNIFQKPEIVRLCATNYRRYGVLLTFWWPCCILLICTWKSPNMKRYPTDSHSAHANYVKTSEIQNTKYTLKSRAKSHVLDFNPGQIDLFSWKAAIFFQ